MIISSFWSAAIDRRFLEDGFSRRETDCGRLDSDACLLLYSEACIFSFLTLVYFGRAAGS
jgi:hypothetical protein